MTSPSCHTRRLIAFQSEYPDPFAIGALPASMHESAPVSEMAALIRPDCKPKKTDNAGAENTDLKPISQLSFAVRSSEFRRRMPDEPFTAAQAMQLSGLSSSATNSYILRGINSGSYERAGINEKSQNGIQKLYRKIKR